jgi:hypothetical protein
LLRYLKKIFYNSVAELRIFVSLNSNKNAPSLQCETRKD